MPHMPRLRVVPLESIRRHEEIDPLRVDRLSQRIGSEGIQVNPMVCVEAADGLLVLLDGATRTESLKRLGLGDAVVQLVDPVTVTLGTWHHVIRGCSPDELFAALAGAPGVSLLEAGAAPRVISRTGEEHHVAGHSSSENAALSALVATYVGRWDVARATVASPEVVEASFPDWAGIVEFPTLTVADVMTAAIDDDPLPAGITRFQVPERALRLNVPLSLLQNPVSQAVKQADLDALLEERARAGRIRRYEEPVFVLDD